MKEPGPQQGWDPPADGQEPSHTTDQSMVRRRRTALGYDGRSERRATRTAARRRKLRARLWLVAVPLVVVIAVVVTMLVLFGGPDGDQPAGGASTTTVAPVGGGEGAALVIGQDRAADAVVLLRTHESSGIMLVIPGITLLLDGDEFATIGDIFATGGGDELASVLADQLEVGVLPVASAPWSTLQTQLTAAGVIGLPTSVGAPEEAAQLAETLRDRISEGGAEALVGMWTQLQVEGDTSEFRAGLRTPSAETRWTAAAVEGKTVEGDGFVYLEPEIGVARALLTGSVNDSAITVELQNGSGVVGAVDGAAAQLQPLGYRLSPSGNSEDFPNAAQTRIVFSTGADRAAARIQALLGVGTLSEDDSLMLDEIVLVLGKDYAPPARAGGDGSE